jgi:cytochrome b561
MKTFYPSVPTNRKPAQYTGLQIALHWVVVVLIAGQWVTSGAIPRTHNPLLPPSETDLLLHTTHNFVGLTIGVLVLLRIALRRLKPKDELARGSGWLDRLSQAIHWALYLSLLSQTAAGFAASYFWAPAGPIHVFLWNITLGLVSIHLAAAAYHTIRCDGVVWRIMPKRY